MANWIAGAIKKAGALRKTLGVSKTTGDIPMAKLVSAANKTGKTAKRARLALTLRKLSHKK